MIFKMCRFIRKSRSFCLFLYATYTLALADASIQDNQVDPALFVFFWKDLCLFDARGDLIMRF